MVWNTFGKQKLDNHFWPGKPCVFRYLIQKKHHTAHHTKNLLRHCRGRFAGIVPMEGGSIATALHESVPWPNIKAMTEAYPPWNEQQDKAPENFNLGGGFKCFSFQCTPIHPYSGKIPILTNIFQRGWNHQLAIFGFQDDPASGDKLKAPMFKGVKLLAVSFREGLKFRDFLHWELVLGWSSHFYSPWLVKGVTTQPHLLTRLTLVRGLKTNIDPQSNSKLVQFWIYLPPNQDAAL